MNTKHFLILILIFCIIYYLYANNVIKIDIHNFYEHKNYLLCILSIIFIILYDYKPIEKFDAETDKISQNILNLLTSGNWQNKQTFNDGISVNNNTNLTGDLNVNNNATVNSLNVNNNATVNSLSFSKGITNSIIQTGKLTTTIGIDYAGASYNEQQQVSVLFNEPFKPDTIPVVTVMCTGSKTYPGPVPFIVDVFNITNKGFTIGCFNAKKDSQVWNPSFNWIAIGEV
jgi:hypothetical protein